MGLSISPTYSQIVYSKYDHFSDIPLQLCRKDFISMVFKNRDDMKFSEYVTYSAFLFLFDNKNIDLVTTNDKLSIILIKNLSGVSTLEDKIIGNLHLYQDIFKLLRYMVKTWSDESPYNYINSVVSNSIKNNYSFNITESAIANTKRVIISSQKTNTGKRLSLEVSEAIYKLRSQPAVI